MNFSLIVAMSSFDNGIGINNKIPWKIPEDLKYFKNITTNCTNLNKMNCVIMGRTTYFSIPKKFRPLKHRINIVLTKNKNKYFSNYDYNYNKNLIVLSSISDCLNYIKFNTNIENIFIIGGESIYKEFIKLPECSKIYITLIYKQIKCDSFFPNFDKKKFKLKTKTEIKIYNNIKYQFLIYYSKNDIH